MSSDPTVSQSSPPPVGALVLRDGSVFEGELIGAPLGTEARPFAAGEVVFNTSLAGYQEITSDPSYAGQIITFTYPHIGNYGATPDDDESRASFARGVVVRDLARRHSNHRATQSFEAYLRGKGISGIAGIDTRRLTRVIREAGAMPGVFGPIGNDEARSIAVLTAAAQAEPGTEGIDLVAQVTTEAPYTVASQAGQRRIVAYDFGIKQGILAQLAELGEVEVVPASTPAAEVLARRPDGVFLSNGPGDPAMSPYAVDAVAALVGQVPIFGICLGHQILGLAIGASIEKLPFGHHGANHPVRDELTGKVEITSQNHNFAVIADSLGDRATVTHINLNDGVVQGMALTDGTAFSVQHHPEAKPGPNDSSHLFHRFEQLMANFPHASGSAPAGEN